MDNQNLKFDFVFLGQSVLKYQVPLDIFTTINQIYEQNYHKLETANKQLVGKIESEHSLFYHGADQSKMKNHNLLPRDVTDYFMSIFKHYLAFNKIRDYKTHLKKFDLNPKDKNFWQLGMDLIKNLMDELEKLG